MDQYTGLYRSFDYVRDPDSGWWESDPWTWCCIYVDRCGGLLTMGLMFFVRGTLALHTCDSPRYRGLLDSEKLIMGLQQNYCMVKHATPVCTPFW